MNTINDLIEDYGMYLAWVVALTGTVGSLLFSERLDLIPCTLCWYQRTLLFPLAIILGVSSFKGEDTVSPYALSLAIPGALLASYHYLLQMVPSMGESPLCRAGIPCGEATIKLFGFVTIPLLSLAAFILIAGLVWRSSALRRRA